jgi:5-methyltetrahydropteroyltriglutamate--homocysteine methyltransferase
VLDIRTTQIESPEQVADRIRKVIAVVPPERVYLTTDCGMKPLPRIVAKMKLKALADGAAIVRKEIS